MESLNSNFQERELHQLQQMQDKAKESCMVSFRLLHSHLKVLSIKGGFERAFVLALNLIEDNQTFTGIEYSIEIVSGHSIRNFRFLDTVFNDFDGAMIRKSLLMKEHSINEKNKQRGCETIRVMAAKRGKGLDSSKSIRMPVLVVRKAMMNRIRKACLNSKSRERYTGWKDADINSIVHFAILEMERLRVCFAGRKKSTPMLLMINGSLVDNTSGPVPPQKERFKDLAILRNTNLEVYVAYLGFADSEKFEAILKSAWTEKDQIDNFLKERRLMRSLESSLVGDCHQPSYIISCGNIYSVDLMVILRDVLEYKIFKNS
ncbi:hypothetical protein Tco_0709065 [Tanacetum coccineum]